MAYSVSENQLFYWTEGHSTWGKFIASTRILDKNLRTLIDSSREATAIVCSMADQLKGLMTLMFTIMGDYCSNCSFVNFSVAHCVVLFLICAL